MEEAIVEILKGIPVAVVLFYFAVQFRKDTAEARKSYEDLVAKILTVIEQTTATVSRNNVIFERVERKLDENH